MNFKKVGIHRIKTSLWTMSHMILSLGFSLRWTFCVNLTNHEVNREPEIRCDGIYLLKWFALCSLVLHQMEALFVFNGCISYDYQAVISLSFVWLNNVSVFITPMLLWHSILKTYRMNYKIKYNRIRMYEYIYIYIWWAPLQNHQQANGTLNMVYVWYSIRKST